MSPITKSRKRNKNNVANTLSDNEFHFIFGGLSYSGECVDKTKIVNLVMEYIKKQKI